MSVASSIIGVPLDVVEIQTAAPVTTEIDRRALQWADATMAIYGEADELFHRWEWEERYNFIMKRLIEFGRTIEEEMAHGH